MFREDRAVDILKVLSLLLTFTNKNLFDFIYLSYTYFNNLVIIYLRSKDLDVDDHFSLVKWPTFGCQ